MIVRVAVLAMLFVFSSRAECQKLPAPDALIRTEFDPAYNKTILNLDPVVLDVHLRMSALITFEGRQMVEPVLPDVVVSFWSTLPEALSDSARVLGASWGNEPLTTTGRLFPVARRDYTEVLVGTVPLELWLLLGERDDAFFQLGPHRVPIGKRARDAIRAFNRRFGAAN